MTAARLRAVIWLLLFLWGGASLGVAAFHSPPSTAPVVIAPIDGTVDEGMAHLVDRSVNLANSENAAALVLDVNSPGGLVASVLEINRSIFSAHVPVIAYVDVDAYSAAALITLSAQHIIVAPGASIGAAEPIPNTPKEVSALTAKFESTAERNHYDPQVAGGMVDRNIVIPGLKPRGTILTLNTEQALHTHVAVALEPTLDAALSYEHLADNPRQEQQYTLAEEIARFATDPTVSGILLSIGMLGLAVELWTLHGIAGIIALLAFALFFGAHIYAGFSTFWIIVLAGLGMVGILLELHVFPGHGIWGILGVILLALAVILAFGIQFFATGLEVFGLAIVATIVVLILGLRRLPENAWVKRLALAYAQGPEYVASRSYAGLQGQTGIAESYLRPSGVALLGDQRVAVLTEGEYIPQGTQIRVTRVEGARIFVEPAVRSH
jgi:membrane-bound serine protease (ClpP class)